MGKCWDWLLASMLLGMLLLGAGQWLLGAQRRRARHGAGWHHFTRSLMDVTLAPVSRGEIALAVSALAEEQGIHEEWQRQFVTAIYARVRDDGYASLEYAIANIRRELEGY